MKCLIIGANGLAGSAFMRTWPALGWECVGVTRQNYAELKGTEADILINASGNSAKYLAAKDPLGEIDRSVASVMRTCIDFKADRYVLLSSADVYSCQSDPDQNGEDASIDIAKLSVYGLCKAMAESVVQNRSEKWLILRLGGLLGPGLKKNPLFDLLTGGKLLIHPNSEFGFIHTDEVARICHFLLNQTPSSDIFNVCGRGLVSVYQMMDWTGRQKEPFSGESAPIRYSINHDKLSVLWQIPETQTTVLDFIKWWKNTH